MVCAMGGILGGGWISKALAVEAPPAFKPVAGIIIDDIGYSLSGAGGFWTLTFH